ncbi:permease prefix domain 2-containing transporter [Fulvivirgaceae bacterium BMA10]|uniref:Permease prefix domain 2-containing transporter n=1 Tax=Splendidivirga corallicola TaxID=3051826 RepID=A0ABT8KNM4_9BACT|nr:permease prefix domain 2-containing transporter [Fulvivirgaceae bacterium BMA10]
MSNNKPHPPKWINTLLRRVCKPHLLEEIEGDLEEYYQLWVDKYGIAKANRLYILHGIKFLRPFALKKSKLKISNPRIMFKHNFLLTFRNFKRYKAAFLINLIGLSSSLACVCLIYLWIDDELNVDKFLEKDNQLFQVLQNVERADGIETIEATSGLLAEALANEIPEIEYSTTVVPGSFNACKGVISISDTRIKSTGQYVSKDFFQVFSYQLLYGDKEQVLSEKNKVVISEELALKLFNSTEDVVGQTIDWKAQDITGSYIISGIFEPMPSNATVQFDLLLSYDLFKEFYPLSSWANHSPHSFVLLKEGNLMMQLNDKIKDFIQSKDANVRSTIFLQQYSDRYLYGHYDNGLVVGGRIQYVKLFTIIAIFTLVIACINFMNLSTAKASRRLKEIGIKKSMGVKRSVLIYQFLQESISIAFLALVMATVFISLFLPQFNEITGKQLIINFDRETVLFLFIITIATGLIAGSYPALYLSGFKSAQVLKGVVNTSKGEFWLRRGLIIFQFTISIILIASVLVIYKQIGFIQSNTMGYDRDQVIYFSIEGMSEAFLSELETIPGVLNVGGGNLTVGNQLGGTDGLSWVGKDSNEKIFFSTLWCSYNLIETLGMEMVEGQPLFGSHNQIIFNEEAIKRMGIKDPIGEIIKTGNGERQIVGVVKNFHFESLYEEIKPCAILLAPMKFAPKISVKLQKGIENTVIRKIQEVYETHNPGLVFDFKFMDADNQRLYESEKRMAILSRYFAGITILISCLGLFGLAAFTAERRVKEIGIRKILGSSVFGIVRMLTVDFTRMVIAAIMIALPVSYLIAGKWLEGFAYRIELEWWFFIGAGIAALLVAWLTVGVQTLRAANVNPTKCLRNE